MTAVTFDSPAAFRRWLAAHHATTDAIVLALAKRESGLSSLTYRQALDEALCFGWIDGIARRIDAATYSVRFTPRRARSYWSAVNLKRYAELEAEGRVAAPGRARYEARDPAVQKKYSFEQKPTAFSPAIARRFRADAKAWAFFSDQPPGYRRTVIAWVMSAKQDATRERRLALLVADSSAGRRLNLVSPGKPVDKEPVRRKR
jgi:uncharacterized protein YdeI (YjbR/CyaY-like superfamily)